MHTKKISPQQRWRNKQADNLKCTVCGNDLTEKDGLRTLCETCRKNHNNRNIYYRWFMGLFK